MALIGCFVTPHPPIAVPEVAGEQLAEVITTVRSLEALREKTAALAPETIVLLSPHAPIAYRHMGISFAASYRGSLAFFRAPQVTVSAEGDLPLAERIFEVASEADVPVAIIASRGERVELDHGAVVPLVYLMGGLSQPCRLVLLAFSQLGLQEHVRFGEAVGKAILEVPQRVLYVASGDLSHRLIPGAPAGFDPRGKEFDRRVVDSFASGDWERLLSIDYELASAAGECGFRSLAVLAGVVAAARSAGLRTANCVLSYEGPFGVGYLVGEVECKVDTGGEAGVSGDPLVALARRAVETYVREGRVITPEPIPGYDSRRAGVFVSVHLRDGSLRGCIGTIEPQTRSIPEEVVMNAVSAATRDPRFYPVRESELPELDISVDVLGPLEKVQGPEDLNPRRYGVVVETEDGRRALLLPDLPGVDTVEQQLRIACRKGGIDPDRENYTIYRFEVERHH